MKSDVVIKLDDFELTKNMDLVESPDFTITKLPDLPLDNEGKPLNLTFLMEDKNLSQARDDLAKWVGRECDLTFSLFPDRFWRAKITEDVSFIRSMDSRLSITVVISFLLTEIKARSKTIKKVSAALNSDGVWEFSVTNNGTVAVPMSYRIKFKKESGYIGIASKDGAMEFGKRTELDEEAYQENDILKVSNTFADWTADTGPNAQNPNIGTNGVLSEKDFSESTFGKNGLYLSNAGTGNYWHGGQKSLILPADSQGELGADKIRVYFNHVFVAGLQSQTGIFMLNLLDEEGKLVCSYFVYKSSPVSGKASANFLVGGDNPHIWKSWEFVPFPDEERNQFSASAGHCSIQKIGDALTCYWRKLPVGEIIVPELKDKKIAKAQYFIGQYGARTLSAKDYMSYNYLRNISFTKINVDKLLDVPNRYQAGPEVFLDGEKSKIFVEGIPRLDDEVKGTKWLLAEPGTNKYQLYFSDFAELDSATAEFEEAFL